MVDAVRGLAVLAMIEWHTAHAWLAGAARESGGFVAAELIGGLAAPSFLLLAGVSSALASPLQPTAAQTWAGVRRGMRIALAGYALSLYAWTVDRAAVLQMRNVPTAIAMALALGLFALAIDDRKRSAQVRVGLAVAGLVAARFVAAQLDHVTRDGASLLPRIDVLHGIGAALVVTSLALHAVRALPLRTRAWIFGVGAITVASLAWDVAGVPQRVLPDAIADWIARDAVRPHGFPLFPWLAYSLLGASVALRLRASELRLDHAWALPNVSRPLIVALAALVIAALAWEPWPVSRAVLALAPSLRSLGRLVFNASVITASAALIATFAPRALRATRALALLGRHSLVVYAVHLEFAYGLAGIPLQRKLGFGAWAVGFVLLVGAMLALSYAIERAPRRDPARVRAVA
ncbi:heparan-alpha-glucosaminide N-acetyltransferase domain-containing protein [Sandaracinus amylolyticus]|uniref:Heparan-alpha-glucosaminide N-acetyltransferase catalytic domain-containing protein n=1 Tax=Sandaracinus amylolyticus TaxID=927083 RepID=A0A0F6YJJ7_9BACT|nr:heparan-alpha-glucosaminide N-acetyltransferase domain-containing protein [Sandaracinus amylolyticus]AKF08141.1 hypothetical protein DB32_005290 [Sandaracinus amylolyticus]